MYTDISVNHLGLQIPREAFSADVPIRLAAVSTCFGDEHARRKVVQEVMYEVLEGQLDLLAPIVGAIQFGYRSAQAHPLILEASLTSALQLARQSCPKEFLDQADGLCKFRMALSEALQLGYFESTIALPFEIASKFFYEIVEPNKVGLHPILASEALGKIKVLYEEYQLIKQEVERGIFSTCRFEGYARATSDIFDRLTLAAEQLGLSKEQQAPLQELSEASQRLHLWIKPIADSLHVTLRGDRRISTLVGLTHKIEELKKFNSTAALIYSAYLEGGLLAAYAAISASISDLGGPQIDPKYFRNLVIHPFGVAFSLPRKTFGEAFSKQLIIQRLPNGLIAMHDSVDRADVPSTFIASFIPMLLSSLGRIISTKSPFDRYAEILEPAKNKQRDVSTALLTGSPRTFLEYSEDAIFHDLLEHSVSTQREPSDFYLRHLRMRVATIGDYLKTTLSNTDRVTFRVAVATHTNMLEADVPKLERLLKAGFEFCRTEVQRRKAYALLSILPLRKWERFPVLAQRFFDRSE